MTVGSLLLLIISASFCESLVDVDDEDPDYEKDFERYDTFGDWIQLSSEVFEWGPMNVRGRLRKRFSLDAALSIESSMVCSPIGAMYVLGQLVLGAEGDCLKQLLISIGLSERAELTRCMKPLMKQLETMDGVNLRIVSKIYVANAFQLKSKFKQRIKRIFNSTVDIVNFKTPLETVRTINNFVDENTNGMIPDVVSQSDILPEYSMFLINVVYFTAQWKTKFEQIKVDNFFSSNDLTHVRKVTMMTKKGQFNYMNSVYLQAQVVEIPYVDENLSFVLILPNAKEGLPEVLEKLKASPDQLQEAMQGLQLTEMMLTIPKFKTEAQLDLRTSFEWLGIVNMLETTNSGLEGIVERNKTIYVSQGIQRVAIDINEKGNEPSAISTLYFSGLDNSTGLLTFTACHPFLYFVKFKREQIIFGTYVKDV